MDQAKSLFKELCKIEEDLKIIWTLLSPAERQKRSVVQKLNRVQVTLHRLKFSHTLGSEPQAPVEQSNNQTETAKRD